jgi:hypothetical protein
VLLQVLFVISGATRGFGGKQQVTGQLFRTFGLGELRLIYPPAPAGALLNENIERDRPAMQTSFLPG